jgi:hypothetical protein
MALGCYGGGATLLTNVRGTLCYDDDSLQVFGRPGFLLEYWSSTSAGYSEGPNGYATAWAANIEFGWVQYFTKTLRHSVWPVRGGSR